MKTNKPANLFQSVMSTGKTLRLILGDQLNSHHPWFEKTDQKVVYLMAEMRQETDYVRHHIQKVAGFFAAMRNFASELTHSGHQFIYHRIGSEESKLPLPELLRKTITNEHITRFEYQMPDEWRLDKQLIDFCSSLDIPTESFDTFHFLSRREELKSMFPSGRSPLMETFYRSMRRKYHILMDGVGNPLGGKWNYDHENRKPYDRKSPLPVISFPDNDCTEIVREIEEAGVRTFGNINAVRFGWPVSRSQSLKLLDDFCAGALKNFGKYQDAMYTGHRILFHSRLSFALNTKMLSPLEVVEKAIEKYREQNSGITLAQIEGFVRQIIGWREYMRGIYWGWMPEFKTMNALNNTRRLPQWFWTGQTSMNCLRHCIGQSLDDAYAHHIQRLMVTGNFMLLAGIHPDDADEWYLGIYIDAIEWVEMPNTRGMSQYADGGIVGTKPYVSSANYINKMSNYCSTCFYDHKKRYGDKACPFNSLYWNFYETHRKKFEKNPRIAMMYRLLDKMTAAERSAIIEQAGRVLENIEKL